MVNPNMVLRNNILILLMWSFVHCAAAQDAKRDLIARLDFEHVTDSSLIDATSQREIARLSGSVRAALGAAALDFEGNDGSLFYAGDIGIGRSASIILWFKTHGISPGGLLALRKTAGVPVFPLRLLLEPRPSFGTRNSVAPQIVTTLANAAGTLTLSTNVAEAAGPSGSNWICYALTFDGREVSLYINGALVETRFQSLVPDFSGTNLYAGFAGDAPAFKGAIADLRFYRRRLSDREIDLIYRRTVGNRTQELASSDVVVIKPIVNREAGSVFVDLDYRGVAQSSERPVILVELFDGSRLIAKGDVSFLPVWGRAEAVFAMSNVPAGRYKLVTTSNGSRTGECLFDWPGRASEWKSVKVLNNFCWELMNVSSLGEKGQYSFFNPRNGWVYFATTRYGKISIIRRDGEPMRITLREVVGGSAESMLWLPKGDYLLRTGDLPSSAPLVVRAIPILLFTHYPHVGPGNGEDHRFLARNVLPSVNTVVTNASETPIARNFREFWVHGMRRECLEIRYLSLLPPLAADLTDRQQQIRAFIVDSSGMAKTEFSGVIFDEFVPDNIFRSAASYKEWIDVMRDILSEPAWRDRKVIPWHAGNTLGFEKSAEFLRTVNALGGYHSREVYLDERDSEKSAWSYMNEVLTNSHVRWEKVLPGVTRTMIITLSYLNREYWNPSVDFKIHMDMQLHHLATRPEFFGLAGLGEYQSHSSTEEYVRYAAALFRHYALEGATTRYSNDPYRLQHIQNGDFADGITGWDLKPATSSSIGARTIRGYGTLQDRNAYLPWTETPFLWIQRAKEGANVISQKIYNLQPGRYYVVRLLVGDYERLMSGISSADKNVISLRVEDAEEWSHWYRGKFFDDKSYVSSGYGVGSFTVANPFYTTLYQLVFRATGTTANLVLSDWLNETDPGGPLGQQLMLNKISVGPYFKP